VTVSLTSFSQSEEARAELERCVEERTRDLTLALARAEEANRSKEAFLAIVSHELRTPLNAILGWVELLQRRPDSAMVQRGLPVIRRNALAQARVVEDLLDVSSIEAGKMRVEARLTDLRIVVSNAIEVVQPAAEAKRIAIVETGGATPAIVLGDPDRLQQIVWNLLANAMKFTPEGGTVHVSTVASAERVRFEVSDNGIGIEAAFLSRVFEPFSQVDMSSTRGYTGLGLGLTLVRTLTELQGGTVRAQSAGMDKGSTFVVELPAHDASIGEDRAIEASTRVLTPAHSADLTGIRVLIVDDDPDSCESVALILETAGASTIVANSAATGLQALLQHKVDVVLSDIAMPHRDGVAFIQDVRALLDNVKRCVPAVALTALAREEDRHWILASGFQRYAAKPVSADHLVRCVAAAAAA
jgi:CheY-like chemotaxis protein